MKTMELQKIQDRAKRDIGKFKENPSFFQIFGTMQTLCHQVAYSCGWWEKPREDGTIIALMHSELSEALEALRKDLKSDHVPELTGLEEELADTVIRIFDFATYKGIKLDEVIHKKLKYNLQREDHKIKNREKSGGKKF